jgi:PAS domain S-box-containing protein
MNYLQVLKINKMKNNIKVLYLEDSPQDIEMLRELLLASDFELEMDCTESEKGFVNMLRNNKYDVILADFKLPGFDGFAALRWAVEICPAIPVIIVSGTIGEETAVELIKLGATDYILKDRLKRLPSAIKRAIEEVKKKAANKILEVELHHNEEIFSNFMDNSPVYIFFKDQDIRAKKLSKNFEQMLGRPMNEIIGKTMDDLFPSDLAKKMIADDKKILSERKTIVVDEELNGRYYSTTKFPVIIDGQPLYLAGYTVDTTERRLSEKTQALNSQRIQTLLQLNQMTDATLQEITDFVLEEAVRLTQSTIGYLAFLNEDESVLTMHSWSKSAMAECAIQDKPIIYPVATTGLWGEAVRQRRPVFTNDYAAANPLKKGYPQGHVAVKRHMNVPVFDGSRIVIVAGVGNKNEEYDESDARQLTLLMESMWRLIERKRADVLLRESEDNYKSLIDNIPEIIFTIDLEGNLTFVSKRTKEILGYESAETINMNILDFVPEEDRQRAMESLQKGMKGEKIAHFQTPMIKKSGERLILECSFSRVFKDGAVIGVQGTAADITERKKAEEALWLKNLVFDSSIAANSIANLSGVITEANDTFLRFWGYPGKDEVVGKPLPQFFDDPNEVAAILTALNETGQWEGNFTGKRQDGSVFLVQGLATTLRDTQGSALGYQSAALDITERKKTEMQLAQLHHYHQLVLDSAAEGILGLDLQGNHTFINRAAARILGYEDEELLGTPSHITWHHTKPDGSPFPKEECAILVTLREGTACRNSNEVFWRKDGTCFPVEYASTPIYEKDQLAGAVITFTDITERKQSEIKVSRQLDELRRWYDATADREERIIEMKKEVNEVLTKAGKPPRYESVI